PQNLSKPTIDLAYWWANAKPGPKHGRRLIAGERVTNSFDLFFRCARTRATTTAVVRRLPTFHLKLAFADAALTGRSAAGITFLPREPSARAAPPDRPQSPGLPPPPITQKACRDAAVSAAPRARVFRV